MGWVGYGKTAFVGVCMFSPVYAGPRAKQPVLFLASLSLQCALVALLCLVPPSKSSCCLRKTDLRAALTTPIYFEPPAPVPTVKAPRVTESFSVPEQPSATKPVASAAQPVEAKLAEPEAKPAEASDTADTAADSAGVAQFPAWQMSSNEGSHGFHHQVSRALPVFTPEPPILHNDYPESARGKEVVMVVIINEEGAIAAFKVLQGVGDGVEKSIVETLKRWIYVPAKFNGRAIATQQELRFQFPG